MALEVAKTILAQLGGNRFIAMTGARRFLGGENELTFALPARFAKDGINKVKITLDVSDTYKVEFWKIGRAPTFKATLVEEFEGIYSDGLKNVFESATGLAVSLGTMGGAS